MADARDARLRDGLDRLKRQGFSPENATVAELEKALEADPTVALAIAHLCGAIASEESARLLERIEAGAASDKVLRREAKRSLYRLKQRGIAGAEAPAPARGVLAGPEAEGFLSFSDPSGDRLLWILRPRPGGGLYHFSTVVNEPAGLKEAVLADVNRKGVRALREELEARHGLRLVGVDWHYCDAISAEGYERARQRGAVAESAAHYPQLRLQLFSTPAPPVKTPLQPPREPVEPNLAASAALFEEPELGRWFLGEETLSPYFARYREIRDSPIVLGRASQLSRLEEIVAGAVEELFSQSSRWQRILDEAAYFFAGTDRPVAAERAAAVASVFREGKSWRGNAFAEELVRRSFGAFFAREAEREREEKASSVLVTPDDIRAERARQPRPRR
jgi:hypothetical protein